MLVPPDRAVLTQNAIHRKEHICNSLLALPLRSQPIRYLRAEVSASSTKQAPMNRYDVSSEFAPERLARLLGVERPVLLAPMAKVSGGRLAAAVQGGGGHGIIGSGYGDPDWLEQEWTVADRFDVGVGFITWSLETAVLARALDLQPASVTLSFGDPRPFAAQISAANATLVCQVGTQKDIDQAFEAGADIIVCQGIEAGGHGRFHAPALELLDLVLSAVPTQVAVIAGGVVDDNDLRKAVAAGAAGVMIGTTACATHEALDQPERKARLVAAAQPDTIVSSVYDVLRGPTWPEGFAGRSLRPSVTDQWAGREAELAGRQEIASWYRTTLPVDAPERVVWAGSAVGRIHQIQSAHELVRSFSTVRELREPRSER
jgi:nitronate monooxygenase